MKIDWIKTQAPRRLPALAKRSGVDAETLEADAPARGIVCGVALLVGATPVVSLLGAMWFLVIQPALH
jgi:hypothetical protein